MIYTVYMWNNSERRDNQSGRRDNQSGRKQGSLYAARYIDGVEILKSLLGESSEPHTGVFNRDFA